MYINKVQIAGDYVLVSNYSPRGFGAPHRKRKKKMMTISFDTYEMIAELLAEGTDLDPTYSVEEVAEMAFEPKSDRERDKANIDIPLDGDAPKKPENISIFVIFLSPFL